MPLIPAFCDRCHIAFSSGMYMGPGVSVTIEGGGMSGPCPGCGGMGKIPNGLFEVVGDVIRIIASDRPSQERVLRLQQILQGARETRQPPEQLISDLRTDTSEWSGLAAYLSKLLIPKSPGDFWAIIGVLLAALALMPSDKKDFDEKQVAVIVEKAVASALEQSEARAQKAALRPVKKAVTVQRSAVQSRKIGRNAPCPCKSGKKYKHCCINSSQQRSR